LSIHAATAAPCRLRHFELNGALRLALDDHGAKKNLVAVSHVSDVQVDEIAAAQLAVDRKVEHRVSFDVTTGPKGKQASNIRPE